MTYKVTFTDNNGIRTEMFRSSLSVALAEVSKALDDGCKVTIVAVEL